MPKSRAAQVINWQESSSHYHTCHRNDVVGYESAKDTELASIASCKEGWSGIINASKEEFVHHSFQRVKNWVEGRLGGKEIDAWE